MTNLQITRADSKPLNHKARRLVGEKTGLLSDVHFHLPQRDDPDVCYARGKTCDLTRLLATEGKVPNIDSGGKGFTPRDSMMRFIGETVERYCAHWGPEYHSYESTLATYDSLCESGETIIDPEFLKIYSDEQYELLEEIEQFHRESEINWIQGTNLRTGESIYIPGAFVSMWADDESSRHYRPCSTSNGMACHESYEQALLSSLYELVERDGFMKYWMRGRTPRRIDLSAFSEIRQLKTGKFDNDRYESHLLYYDTDYDIETVGCVVINNQDRAPKFLLGGAASVDLRTAMEEALLEGAQGLPYAKYLVRHYGERSFDRGEMTDLEKNVVHYLWPKNFDDARFFINGETVVPDTPPRRSFSTREKLERCLDALDKSDVRPIAADFTTTDIRDVGFRVTSVWAPELVPISLPAMPPKEHPALEPYDISDKPHPYP